MAKIIVIIVAVLLLLGLIFLFVYFIKNHFTLKHILERFKGCNVIVDGKKGSGKDLVFAWVLKKRKKDDYYSNINYGYKYHNVELKDMNVLPNTYEKFINNDLVKIPRSFKEKTDFYISDGGVYLPSYMDAKLYNKFPSLPIFYALSRHLYNSNVHVNVQNFGRLWKALREQADYFIHVKHTIKLPFILITTFTAYDKYESALKYLEPVNSRIMNKYSKAEVDIYNATNGEIKKGFIIQLKHSIHYDTRAFEKKILKGQRLKRVKRKKLA